MFDFSFGEIFVIAVVAVIFLGPDKLPQTFVKIAKFLRAIKKTINDAKDTLDREIHITEMKQDALEYKKKFADSAEKLKNEILKDSDVEGIKREIEGAKSAAILNESLEKSSISFDEVESKGKAVQARLKSNLKQKNAESSSVCHSERNKVKRRISKENQNRDSSPLAQNDNIEKIAESSKKPKKTNLDSANKKPKQATKKSSKKIPAQKNGRAKNDGSN